jgi:hypothetical protein
MFLSCLKSNASRRMKSNDGSGSRKSNDGSSVRQRQRAAAAAKRNVRGTDAMRGGSAAEGFVFACYHQTSVINI